MADINPQKEDGYVPVANAVMDALCKAQLSGLEFRIVHAVIRSTWGWNETWCEMSLPALGEMTGIRNRGHLSRLIAGLVKKNVLVKKTQWGHTTKYRIQKRFTQWRFDSQVSTDLQVNPHAQTVDFQVSTDPQVSTDSTVDSQVNRSTDLQVNPHEGDTLLHERHVQTIKTGRYLHPLLITYSNVFSANLPDSVLDNANSGFSGLETLEEYDEDTSKVIIKRWAKHKLAEWRQQPQNAQWQYPHANFFVKLIERHLKTGTLPGDKPKEHKQVTPRHDEFIFVEPSNGTRWLCKRQDRAFLEACCDVDVRYGALSEGPRPMGIRIEEDED